MVLSAGGVTLLLVVPPNVQANLRQYLARAMRMQGT
jgi:hypothetical protein